MTCNPGVLSIVNSKSFLRDTMPLSGAGGQPAQGICLRRVCKQRGG